MASLWEVLLDTASPETAEPRRIRAGVLSYDLKERLDGGPAPRAK